MSINDISELIINKELKEPIPWLFFDNLNDNDKLETKGIVCYENIQHSLYNALFEAAQIQYEHDEESDVSQTVHSLFKETIKGYANLHQIRSNVSFSTNRIEKTARTTNNSISKSAKNTKTRGDFICYLDEIPIIIGEEKKHGQDMSSCSEELEESVGLMSPLFYHKMPFVLCYVATGKYLKFFAYIRRCSYYYYI